MNEPDPPQVTRVFLRDSVPTAHLKLAKREDCDMSSDENTSENKSAPVSLKKTAPTGHLPKVPSTNEPGASVPTGHLPSDAPKQPLDPAPKPDK